MYCSIYINDNIHASSNLKSVLFADDKNVFYSSEYLENIDTVVNEINVINGHVLNKLLINIETNNLIFIYK